MTTSVNEHIVTNKIKVYLYPDLLSKTKSTYRAGTQSRTPLRKLCAAIVKYVLPFYRNSCGGCLSVLQECRHAA
jgi:hypothetical protein